MVDTEHKKMYTRITKREKIMVLKNSLFILIGIVVLGLVSSCGQKQLTVEKTVYKETPTIEGFYYFENGGAIEVNVDAYGRVSIYTLDYLTSLNENNNTYGEHPKTNVNDVYLISEKEIVYSTNVNYTTGDIEDSNGNDITGTKRTDFKMIFENNQLKVNIKIYSNSKYNNVNYVITERNLIGVK